MSESIAQLLSRRRWCYYIPADGYVEGHGYRVSVVFEYESGHFPTGDDAWIAGDATKKKPWFWGHVYSEACKAAVSMNQQRLGLSPREAAHIVTTSMSIKDNSVPDEERK